MTKFIIGERLSKHHIVKSISFQGATIDNAKDLVKPVLKPKPRKRIIHVGTNNIKNDSKMHMQPKLASVVESIEQEHPSVEIGLSLVVHRQDDSTLNTSTLDKINLDLEKYCQQNNIYFINNDNTKVEQCLNRSGLHLNRKGSFVLAANFSKFINRN